MNNINLEYKNKYLKYKKKYINLKKSIGGNFPLKIRIPKRKLSNDNSDNLVKKNKIKDWFYEYKKYKKSFLFINPIGKGSFGEVFVFPYKNKSYVVKEISKQNISNINSIIKENRILTNIKHPFISHSEFKYKEDIDNYYILMNNIRGEELFDYLYTKNNFTQYTNNLKKILPLFIQMVLFNYYLHSRNLVHLDIKPENYMIENDNQNNIQILHLIDFGLSECLKVNSKLCDRVERRIINPESINIMTGTNDFLPLSMINLFDRHYTSYVDDYYIITLIFLFLYLENFDITITKEFSKTEIMNNKEERFKILNNEYLNLKRKIMITQNTFKKKEYNSVANLFEWFIIKQEERYNEFIEIYNNDKEKYNNYHRFNACRSLLFLKDFFEDNIVDLLTKENGILDYIDNLNNSNKNMDEKRNDIIILLKEIINNIK